MTNVATETRLTKAIIKDINIEKKKDGWGNSTLQNTKTNVYTNGKSIIPENESGKGGIHSSIKADKYRGNTTNK